MSKKLNIGKSNLSDNSNIDSAKKALLSDINRQLNETKNPTPRDYRKLTNLLEQGEVVQKLDELKKVNEETKKIFNKMTDEQKLQYKEKTKSLSYQTKKTEIEKKRIEGFRKARDNSFFGKLLNIVDDIKGATNKTDALLTTTGIGLVSTGGLIDSPLLMAIGGLMAEHGTKREKIRTEKQETNIKYHEDLNKLNTEYMKNNFSNEKTKEDLQPVSKPSANLTPNIINTVKDKRESSSEESFNGINNNSIISILEAIKTNTKLTYENIEKISGISNVGGIVKQNNLSSIKTVGNSSKSIKSGVVAGKDKSNFGILDKLKKMFSGKSFLKISIGLGIISGAIFVLAKALQQFNNVTWTGVFKGITALALLTPVLFLLSKIKSKGLISASMSILALSSSVGILGFSLLTFKKIDYEDIGKAVLTLTALAGLGFLFQYSGIGLIMGGIGVISIATGLMILGHSLSLFKNITEENIKNALFILTGLASLGILFNFTGAGLLIGGIGVLAISLGLLLLAPALKSLSNVDEETIGKTLQILTGLGLIGLILAVGSPGLILGGTGLIVLSLGLLLLAPALKSLSNVDEETIGKTLQILVGLSLVGALLTVGSPGLILGGTSLIVLSLGLLMLSVALNQFKKLNYENGMLLMLGAEILSFSFMVGAGSPAIMLASLAIGSMGFSLMKLGKGTKKASENLTKLGEGMTTFMELDIKKYKDLPKILKPLSKSLKTFVKSFGGWGFKGGLKNLRSVTNSLKDLEYLDLSRLNVDELEWKMNKLSNVLKKFNGIKFKIKTSSDTLEFMRILSESGQLNPVYATGSNNINSGSNTGNVINNITYKNGSEISQVNNISRGDNSVDDDSSN